MGSERHRQSRHPLSGVRCRAYSPAMSRHRPTAVSLLTTNKDGEAVVMLVPLTTLEPENNPFALEVPEIELRRTGLDPSVRERVIANEYNFEAYMRTYYLEASALMGEFTSKGLSILFRPYQHFVIMTCFF